MKPRAANHSATSVPSCFHARIRQPPPGQTITPAPLALPGAGRYTVKVGSETLRSMGVPAARPVGGWKVVSGPTPGIVRAGPGG